MAVEEGERVTVRISSRRPVRAKLVDRPLPGLTVERTDLSAALGREDAGVRIAASRFGEELTVGRLGTLAGRVGDDGMTVAFGAPERGLPDILGIEASAVTNGGDGVEPTADPGFDLWLNTVPDQGSEVVRTEEALFATLAPLSLQE
jgi:predicted SPOUT superfamily RNA methylase MTH1